MLNGKFRLLSRFNEDRLILALGTGLILLAAAVLIIFTLDIASVSPSPHNEILK